MSTSQREFDRMNLADAANFSQLYDHFAPVLWRHILVRTRSHEEADEILSKVFLKVWEYVRRRKKVRNVRGFLWTVTDRLIVDFYRARSLARARFADFALFERADPAEIPNFEDRLAAREKLADVLQALERLRPDDRLVLSLRFIEGMDVGEVAATIGKSKNATSVAVHRALKRLMRELGASPSLWNFQKRNNL